MKETEQISIFTIFKFGFSIFALLISIIAFLVTEAALGLMEDQD
jgi:hypothetical protein